MQPPDCALFCDAECNERNTTFPAAACIATCKHPNLRFPFLRLFALQTLQAWALVAVEVPGLYCTLLRSLVTYTSVLYVHGAVLCKLEQHADLCRHLSTFGWQNYKLNIFVVGHLGVIRQDNAHAGIVLTYLGIPSHIVTPFLSELVSSSLHKSCASCPAFPLPSRCSSHRVPSLLCLMQPL